MAKLAKEISESLKAANSTSHQADLKPLVAKSSGACGSHRLCMGGCSSYCGPQSIVDQDCLSGYLRKKFWVNQIS